MADNVQVTAGSGTTMAADEVTRNAISEKQQIVKISLGAENAFDTLVDSGQQLGANSIPVVLASDIALPTGSNVIGALSANQTVNVAQVGGTSTATGNGATSAGTLRVTLSNDSTGTVIATQSTASSLNAQVVGNVAGGATDSGNPVKIGGIARTSSPTAVTANQRVDAMYDTLGKQVVLPYANPENFINGAATLTATTDTAVLAAAGSGVRNYITSVTGSNTSATAVRVDIKDGTTVVASFYCAPSGGGFQIPFPTPIRGTANTAVNFALSSAVTDVRVSAQGYKGV